MWRYKQAHGIGDMKLQKKIAEALGDSRRERVPLKTLQRFLADQHRTDDVFIHHCVVFLSKVAPPPAEEELGAGLAKFLNVAEGSLREFAGTYRSVIRPLEQPASQVGAGGAGLILGRLLTGRFASVTARNPAPLPPTAWSRFTLEERPHGGFLYVRELLLEPGQPEPSVPPAEEKSWLGNTGVFVPCSANEYLIMVRSFIDVRLYLLRKRSEDGQGLEGTVMTSTGEFSVPAFAAKGPWQPSAEILIERAK